MISTLIKRIMKEFGFQQRALADVLGVGIDRVKSLTSGRVQKLTREESEALIKKLNIRGDWLATGEGQMIQSADDRPRLTRPELATLAKDVVGDAPARYALNPSDEFEVRLKRVAEMSQVTTRIYSELGYMPSSEWVSLIQMLLFDRHLDETGARQIIDLLKRLPKGDAQ